MAAKEPVWKFGLLRRELVKLVGCCWLARTPRTSGSDNSVALYPDTGWEETGLRVVGRRKFNEDQDHLQFLPAL